MYMHVYKNNASVHAIDGAGKHFVACSRAAYVAIQVFKGAVRRNIFYTISILFESTFHTRKYSVLTKSISHHVPEIFRFL